MSATGPCAAVWPWITGVGEDLPTLGQQLDRKPETYFVADKIDRWLAYYDCLINTHNYLSIYFANAHAIDDPSWYIAIRAGGFDDATAPVMYAISRAETSGLWTYAQYVPADPDYGQLPVVTRLGLFYLRSADYSAPLAWNVLAAARGAYQMALANGLAYWPAYVSGAYQQYMDEAMALDTQWRTGAWVTAPPGQQIATFEAGWTRLVNALGQRMPSAAEYTRQAGQSFRYLP